MKLTPKQQRFCEIYIELGNASEAYRQVYDCQNMKPATIKRKAKELLDNGNIAATINEMQSEHRDRHDVTVDRIVNELSKLAFYSASDFLEWGEKGVKVVDCSKIPPDQLGVVQGASQTITQHGGTIRLQLPDKLKALDQLARIFGMYSDNVNINNRGYDRAQAEHEAEIARKKFMELYNMGKPKEKRLD